MIKTLNGADVATMSTKTDSLKFGLGNGKLPEWIAVFDLPAGHSCPFARECKSSANRETGKITDGPDVQFRCYAATAETYSPETRAKRWANYDALKGKTQDEMVALLTKFLPWDQTTMCRPHSAGDFFSQTYFDAWMEIARQNPTRLFYAYTKALPLWVKRLGQIPANFKLTASYGGTHDYLIEQHNLRSAKVVKSQAEADAMGLEIEHDMDEFAWGKEGDFALLVHATQPKGTPMAAAWNVIRKNEGGYNKAKSKAKRLANAAAVAAAAAAALQALQAPADVAPALQAAA